MTEIIVPTNIKSLFLPNVMTLTPHYVVWEVVNVTSDARSRNHTIRRTKGRGSEGVENFVNHRIVRKIHIGVR